MMEKQSLQQAVKTSIKNAFAGCTNLKMLSTNAIYSLLTKAIVVAVKPFLVASMNATKNRKKVFYVSIEFLMGRQTKNNLNSLNIEQFVAELLQEAGISIENIFEEDSEPAIGNGGLGRLAACFIDAAAELGISFYGFTNKYENGFLFQKLINNHQVAFAEKWLDENGNYAWEIPFEELAVDVPFTDIGSLHAVPMVIPVIGYQSNFVNPLFTWSVKDNPICKALYPDDREESGKILRMRQGYFLSYCTCFFAIRDCKANGHSVYELPKYYAIQINDTHAALSVPILFDLLHNQEGVSEDDAIKIIKGTVSYTNHTVLPEALEILNDNFLRMISLPTFDALNYLNIRFINELHDNEGMSYSDIGKYQFNNNGNIYTSNLLIASSKHVNGVAELHTNILKDTLFKQWNKRYPNLIVNHTNGVTILRWLKYSNPDLSNIITDLLGNEDWVKNFDMVKQLKNITITQELIAAFKHSKANCKSKLFDYINKYLSDKCGQPVDILADFGNCPVSDIMVDIQVKRIHMYKRQDLNLLGMIRYYLDLKQHKIDLNTVKPRVTVIGGKAAHSYERAKSVINAILNFQDMVNNDPETKSLYKIVFIENFNVTKGEFVYAAADVSQQISTPGQEASGTGNMKFMMNGAVTLGTEDGANIEIFEEASKENNFVLPHVYADIKALEENKKYNPKAILESSKELQEVIEVLKQINPSGDLYEALFEVCDFKCYHPDKFYTVFDFETYVKTLYKCCNLFFTDQDKFVEMQLKNVFSSSKFAATRTILEYAKDWEITPIDMN